MPLKSVDAKNVTTFMIACLTLRVYRIYCTFIYNYILTQEKGKVAALFSFILNVTFLFDITLCIKAHFSMWVLSESRKGWTQKLTWIIWRHSVIRIATENSRESTIILSINYHHSATPAYRKHFDTEGGGCSIIHLWKLTLFAYEQL